MFKVLGERCGRGFSGLARSVADVDPNVNDPRARGGCPGDREWKVSVPKSARQKEDEGALGRGREGGEVAERGKEPHSQ